MPISFTDFVDITGDPEFFEVLDNKCIAKLTGMQEKRVKRSTRIDIRHILKEDKEPIDIAMAVTRKLFERLGICGGDCEGMIIINSQNSREVVQNMTEQVAQEMGIVCEVILGFPYGCVGFPKGVEESAKRAMNIAPDKHFVLLNIETPDRQIDARDSRATPIFAAGATGTTLWQGPGHRLLFSETKDVEPPHPDPDAEYIFKFIYDQKVHDFFGNEVTRTIFRMNGDLAYVNGQALIEQASRQSMQRVMEMGDYSESNVFAVPHNPNAKIMLALDDMVGPEMNARFVNGAEGMGNTISCTIPSTLARIDEVLKLMKSRKEETVEIKDGDIVLFPAAGICVRDPEKKMSQGWGAMEWHLGAYKNEDQ
ncbi:hypothetical protein KJ652_04195 [Patescibacteria group bacterium]|nr:hypothetical protein [Patescibacteria group bacterium]MBU1123767.1 hypothetical protein [Patescibacteria group bacterium]MBU1911461.1 hypothetical protein [Patescibacteria group bacterium]